MLQQYQIRLCLPLLCNARDRFSKVNFARINFDSMSKSLKFVGMISSTPTLASLETTGVLMNLLINYQDFENSYTLLADNDFRKTAPSQMFNRALYVPLREAIEKQNEVFSLTISTLEPLKRQVTYQILYLLHLLILYNCKNFK